MAERAQTGVLVQPLHNLCISLGLGLLSGERRATFSVCVFCKVDVSSDGEKNGHSLAFGTFTHMSVCVLCFDITMISIQAAHSLF